MNPRRIATLAGGLTYAVIGVAVGLLAPPIPNTNNATAITIRTYFTAHNTAITVSLVGIAVATCGLLVFVIALSSGKESESASLASRIASGAVVVATALTMTGLLAQSALSHAMPTLASDDLLLFAYRLQVTIFHVGPPIPMAIVLGALAVATFQEGILPRWLGAAATVLAGLVGVVGLTNIASREGLPIPFDIAGFLLTAAWVAAAAITSFGPARVTAAGRAQVNLPSSLE